MISRRKNILPPRSYHTAREHTLTLLVLSKAAIRIVLYTDGIVEAKDTLDEQYGTVRFKKILDSDCDLAADKFAEALLEDVCCLIPCT